MVAIVRGIHDGLNTGSFWLFRGGQSRVAARGAFHLILVRQGWTPAVGSAMICARRISSERESGFVRARSAAALANSPAMESVCGSEPK
jgi:hypothetical protein